MPIGTRLTCCLNARKHLTDSRVARKLGAHRLGMRLFNERKKIGMDSVAAIASIYAPQLREYGFTRAPSYKSLRTTRRLHLFNFPTTRVATAFVPPVVGQGQLFSPVNSTQHLTWNEYRLTPAAFGPGGLPYNPMN